MKTFEVELCCVSYITMTVEANDEEEAETMAWKRVNSNSVTINDGQWNVEYIRETQGE